jgi:hypothetical protein
VRRSFRGTQVKDDEMYRRERSESKIGRFDISMYNSLTVEICERIASLVDPGGEELLVVDDQSAPDRQDVRHADGSGW